MRDKQLHALKVKPSWKLSALCAAMMLSACGGNNGTLNTLDGKPVLVVAH